MGLFDKYKQSYGKQIEAEMLWDVALRYKGSTGDWKIVPMKSKRYWAADPFLFDYKGKMFLFYERFDRKREVGEIAVSEVFNDLSTDNEKCIITQPYHLSFPNVFEYNSEFFLIPESSSNHSLDIYRADDFPYKWSHFKTISYDINAVDTIVYSKEGNLVLHTSIMNGDACKVENYLVFLDEDLNIKSLVKNKDLSDFGNRNAGNVIIDKGKRIRVGQDCRGGEYGAGLVLYELLDDYKEKQIKCLKTEDIYTDNEFYSGIHTYNTCGEFEVIDLRYLKKRSLIEKLQFVFKLGVKHVKRRIQH